MNNPQAESLTITDPAAARALRQDNDFLGRFVEPRSPSQVAGSLGIAANLAHHHASKLADLGLLFVQRREGGRVFYQLAARTFLVPSDLFPPGDELDNGSAGRLAEGFVRAYQYDWARMQAGEEDVYGFGSGEQPAAPLEAAPQAAESPYPTHLDSLTLNLSPQRYRALAQALSALLTAAAAEGHSSGGQPCTLGVMTFRAEDSGAGQQLSRNLDSFLGLD